MPVMHEKSDSNVSSKPRNNRQVNSRFMSPSASFSSSLADHISDDRRRDSLLSLTRQRSRKEQLKSNDDDCSNENDRPLIAGSLRNTAKFTFPGKSTSSSSSSTIYGSPSMKKQSSKDSCIGSGRFSLDNSAMYEKLLSSHRNHPDCVVTTSIESEPGCFNSPSRKPIGREVSSKCMVNKGSSGIKRTNSVKGNYKSAMSQWALSPGRSGSPIMSVENKEKPLSFSSLRPPNKSVEKILSMGFDLFRTSKSSSPSKSSLRIGNSEDVHALRLLHNQLLQWRFANARAHAANQSVSHQAESNLISALDGLTKLRHSVVQKKIQLEREKLKMKLNSVLQSQMKLLETWGSMGRQHLPAIAVMKESLHSVVCKVPLSEGARVDIESASEAQKHASDLTASIKLLLTSFLPSADTTAELLSELAEVVAQEKLLLDEFHDLFQTVCVLQVKERSGKCGLIQLQS